ncbi:PAS domain-containing methyl-accepting chemotaxis protein [Halomonas aquamarina]|uniref:PAS domain-containing methyl-accepting chemotaxis protein n=1 Tax=Vreelandella aquamarina TaxID=77097 RepID=A0ACC5VQY1_9GAMM|nr:PAS domain-containing methyl-accepting chemotaxis protein [Halomonas aquamarina]MBZ5486111.1 PAS domain-containing methyl-accepting chemotaxis protein [Halomonas aquamarina]
MLGFRRNSSMKAALWQHTAYITFTPTGHIKKASPLFLTTMGYTLKEIEGKHHRMFCSHTETQALEYQAFWKSLADGESRRGTFRRFNAKGDEVWLEATYLPTLDRRGRVKEIVKIANDITEAHIEAERKNAVLQALNGSMAVIEFTPDGHVLGVNANFERAMGYTSDSLIGSHHKRFCTPEFYRMHPNFWQDLAQGEAKQGKFERLNAQGRSVWLEATYNPIFDSHGQVFKVVKFATDITSSIEESEAAKAAVHSAQSTSTQTEQIARSGLTHLQRVMDDAKQAAQTLAEAQKLVGALTQQAQSIDSITTSIARIANQTNLLSLNAAVEAARAGEQGRGFAVVANEVRQLAKGSSEAVDEITRVLKENTALVMQTTAAMQQVVEQGKSSQESVSEIEMIVSEILTGARNVSTSIDQLALESPEL